MNLKNVSAAITMAAAMVVIGGCQSDEGRFDPRSLGDANREASHSYTADPLKPLPTTLRSQFMPDEKDRPSPVKEPPVKTPLAPDNRVIHLSLREVEQRAVANNLNVKVSGYNPAIDETRVTEAEARFDPEAFTNLTYTANRPPLTSVTGPVYDSVQIQAGLRQLLPSGGQLELSASPTHYNFKNDAANGNFPNAGSDNAFWSTQVQAQLTQPLLQNFGNDVNQARIVINRLNQRVTLLEFRKDLEDTVKNTEEAYWRLAQAQRDQEILERLLQRTIDTSDIVSKRFGQDVTLEQISNSVSRVETTRAQLIRARQRVRDLSDQLKGFMNDAEFPTASDLLILTADKPLEQLVKFDFADTIATALVNRYDIGEQQLKVDSAGVALSVAKNNELPQLNFVGSIGEGGNSDNFGDSFRQAVIKNQANLNWSAGLQFVQKLGNREPKAIYRRSLLQRQQAITQYQATIETATLEVKTAQREVESSWEAIGQSRSARFAAAKALEVVETLERGGEALRPDFIERKLQRQQDLAQAEQAETDAVASYNIAISDLEKKKGTLLRYNNIVLDKKMFEHNGQ